jgi:hypothetical protein
VYACACMRDRIGDLCVVTDLVRMFKVNSPIRSNKASSLVVRPDFLLYVIY